METARYESIDITALGKIVGGKKRTWWHIGDGVGSFIEGVLGE